MLISENVHACQHGSICCINFGTCLQMMEWVSSKALISFFHNYISLHGRGSIGLTSGSGELNWGIKSLYGYDAINVCYEDIRTY